MIVSCKKCSAKYRIKPNSLGEGGRRVRCTKCSHIWLQKPVSENIVQKPKVNNANIALSRRLPVVIEYVVPKWFKAMPAVFSALILVTGFFVFQDHIGKTFPITKKMYEKIGLSFTDQIMLDNVDVVRIGENVFDINGFIVNGSGDKRKLPNIVVRAIGNNNAKVTSFVIKPVSGSLSSGAKYPFFKRVENLPLGTKVITLEVADKFDGFYRKG